jgi:hypothetical protein
MSFGLETFGVVLLTGGLWVGDSAGAMRPPRPSLPKPAAAVVAVVVVFVLAGCGGSGSTSTSGSGSAEALAAARSPGGQRLIAAADRICERLNQRLIATMPAKSASPGVLGKNALAHAALERTALLELAKLPAPVGLRPNWVEILNAREVLVSQLLAAGHAWLTNDKQQLTQLAQAKLRLHNAVSLLAHRDGFKACTKIGTAN